MGIHNSMTMILFIAQAFVVGPKCIAGELIDGINYTNQFRLGGNSEGALQVFLGNGRPAVYTDRLVDSIADAEEMTSALRRLAESGDFVPILDTSTTSYQNGGFRLRILMEDMRVSGCGNPVATSGDQRNLKALRHLSVEQRTAIRNEFLSKQAMHPDGHGMNIMFREVYVEGRSRVDVRLIDPFEAATTLEERAEQFSMPRHGVYAQYNPDVNARWVDDALDLPRRPNPNAMLNVGRGYGLAAEDAFANQGPRYVVSVHPTRYSCTSAKDGASLLSNGGSVLPELAGAVVVIGFYEGMKWLDEAMFRKPGDDPNDIKFRISEISPFPIPQYYFARVGEEIKWSIDPRTRPGPSSVQGHNTDDPKPYYKPGEHPAGAYGINEIPPDFVPTFSY